MIKYSYYCDRCDKEIYNINTQSSTLRILTEREFQKHSKHAERFIDRWSGNSILLCEDCTHTLINLISNSDAIIVSK